MKTILFLLLAAAAFSRPPVEIIRYTDNDETTVTDLNPVLRVWWRRSNNPPQPRLIAGDEQLPGYLPGDVVLWLPYHNLKGEPYPLAKGDLVYYTAVTTGQEVLREIATTEPLKTTRNFPVPVDRITGVVVRVLRVTN